MMICASLTNLWKRQACIFIDINSDHNDKNTVEYVSPSTTGDFSSIFILERCQLTYRCSIPAQRDLIR